MNQLTIDDLEITLERKQIKNINLRLYPPHGAIRVTAPLRVSDEAIKHFVVSKKNWILKRIQIFKNQKHVLHNLDLTLDQKRILSEQIDFYMKKWQTILGLNPIKWSIRKTKTRWGSYSLNTKKISLSAALAYKPAYCVEYVVLHELSHVFVPNHGPRFKNILNQHMPQWKTIQDELRQK